MPRPKAENARKVNKPKGKRPILQAINDINGDFHSEDETDEIPRSPNASETDSKKSLLDIEEEAMQPADFGGGMSKLLERFSSDLNKTMQAKKRKLEQITQESTRCTTKKVLETSRIQSAERRKLIEHFHNQMASVLQQSEAEIEKMKEAEDKLQKVFVQQHKHQQQLRISHSQRLKTLKNLGEEFCKGMNELEGSHEEQFSATHGELKREMALLQKKFLMDIQEEEMMKIRKNLKQILT